MADDFNLDEAIAMEEKHNRIRERRRKIEGTLHQLVDHEIGFEQAIDIIDELIEGKE